MKIVPDLVSGSAPVSFWNVPTIHWEFPYFLAQEDIPGASYTFHVPTLESVIGYFYKDPWLLLVQAGI